MAQSDITISPQQELQFRSWAKDPVKFCCDAVRILTPRGKVVPFDMEQRPYQIDCMRRFVSSQICAVLKARQIGLTTVACGLALWLLLFQPNRFVLVLSKNDEDAKKFLKRIKGMYERLPGWVRARGPQVVGRWGSRQAEFDNGSVIYSATSGSDHGRGDTPTDVFLDEAGFMRNQEDSWSALLPAVEEGGHLRIFGTAKGFRDWFHRRWMEWVDDPDVDDIFYGWDSIPGRDQEWADRMRRKLGEAKFKREYPATAEEAFQTSGSMVFSPEVLLELAAWEPRRCEIVRREDGTFGLLDAEPSSDLQGLFVYEPPVPDAKYLTWADPAEGLSAEDDEATGDYSAIQVLRWKHGAIEQVATYRARMDPEDLADLDHQLSLLYNRALVLVERNNHGHTMLKRLARNRTPNIVFDKGKPGLWTSASSKATDIAVTRKALADGHLLVRDQATIDELFGFQEKKTTGGNIKYEGAEFDDLVDALCGGCGYAVAHAPYDQPEKTAPPEDEPPHPYSLDGFMLAARRRKTSSLI